MRLTPVACLKGTGMRGEEYQAVRHMAGVEVSALKRLQAGFPILVSERNDNLCGGKALPALHLAPLQLLRLL